MISISGRTWAVAALALTVVPTAFALAYLVEPNITGWVNQFSVEKENDEANDPHEMTSNTVGESIVNLPQEKRSDINDLADNDEDPAPPLSADDSYEDDLQEESLSVEALTNGNADEETEESSTEDDLYSSDNSIRNDTVSMLLADQTATNVSALTDGYFNKSQNRSSRIRSSSSEDDFAADENNPGASADPVDLASNGPNAPEDKNLPSEKPDNPSLDQDNPEAPPPSYTPPLKDDMPPDLDPNGTPIVFDKPISVDAPNQFFLIALGVLGLQMAARRRKRL